MLVVRLDHAFIGAGPATVVAHVSTVREYLTIATDRDGARDPKLRLWDGDQAIGTRVVSRLICGTGKGITYAQV